MPKLFGGLPPRSAKGAAADFAKAAELAVRLVQAGACQAGRLCYQSMWGQVERDLEEAGARLKALRKDVARTEE